MGGVEGDGPSRSSEEERTSAEIEAGLKIWFAKLERWIGEISLQIPSRAKYVLSPLVECYFFACLFLPNKCFLLC